MEVAEPLVIEVERVEELAVDVELGLAPGAVADAHGRRVAPAAQVRELTLAEIVLAADAVHDLERVHVAGAAAGRARHEGDEVLGLVGAGADVERLQREARVTDPGVAVVPVALPADGLGQRGRGRGDDRPGGAVGQPLEHPRAELHELLVRAVVDVVLELPRAPAFDRVVDAAGDLGRRGRLRRIGDGRHAGADDDLVRAAEGATAFVGLAEERPHEAVLGPRRELHRQLDRAGDTLNLAQQLVRRVEAERMAALSLCERERVAQHHRAGPGRERRLEHEGVRQVAALDRVFADGRDRPVARVGIEDPAEDRRAVEARQAEPVDRAVRADERGRVAVGEQAVGGDRLRAAGG